MVASPATSSPGLAFLMTTIAAKGEAGYLDYWKALKANGVKVVKGWTEAYTVEFSGSSGKGSRPLVLSYSSSPAYEPKTENLNQTCFRQIEYAGVIAGAQNEVGARKFVDFMLSQDVQARSRADVYVPDGFLGEAPGRLGSEGSQGRRTVPFRRADQRPAGRMDQGLDGRRRRLANRS